MPNIDRMRDEQLKNEKAEAEDSSFFYRQTDPLTLLAI